MTPSSFVSILDNSRSILYIYIPIFNKGTSREETCSMIFVNDALFKINTHLGAARYNHSVVLVTASRSTGADGVNVGVNEGYLPFLKGI